MKILGIDVSRNWAIVVLLCEFTSVSPLQFSKSIKEPAKGYARFKGNIQLNEIAYKLECNSEAIEIIKSLEVNAMRLFWNLQAIGTLVSGLIVLKS